MEKMLQYLFHMKEEIIRSHKLFKGTNTYSQIDKYFFVIYVINKFIIHTFRIDLALDGCHVIITFLDLAIHSSGG
jgi:hypothetical protein